MTLTLAGAPPRAVARGRRHVRAVRPGHVHASASPRRGSRTSRSRSATRSRDRDFLVERSPTHVHRGRRLPAARDPGQERPARRRAGVGRRRRERCAAAARTSTTSCSRTRATTCSSSRTACAATTRSPASSPGTSTGRRRSVTRDEPSRTSREPREGRVLAERLERVDHRGHLRRCLHFCRRRHGPGCGAT